MKAIGRVASKAGRWLTATTRSASAASRANKILRKVKIGGYGIGYKKHRIALPAPHAVNRRYSKKVADHGGRWHIHTGRNRTPRRVFRVWRKI